MFDNEFPPLGGGTGVVNYHLLRELTAADVAVDLITSSRSRRQYEQEEFAPRITIHKVPVDNRNIHHSSNRELLRYSWRGLRYAYRLAAKHRYDVSLAFAGVPAGALSYALRLTHGIPYVLSLQGPDVPGFEARYAYLYPVLTPLLRRIWRAAGAVTVTSADQAALARRTLPDLALTVIPNGVDTGVFYPAGRRTGEEVTVVCAARLIERKGQHHLIAALALVKKACRRRVRVRLVGTGDAEPHLRQLAEHLEVSDAITFEGYVPGERMPDIYRAADLFVLPSYQEGMSIALLEAMASGLPVVVTEAGGTAELVTSGLNGEIVPWANVEALAHALTALIEDEAARARMGAASRQRAMAFGWQAHATQYLDLCTRVATGATVEPGATGSSSCRSWPHDWRKESRA